jgi:predicted nucleic acid-binding protein
MNNWFVDTNIIIDLISDRKPFSKPAIPIFKMAEDGKIGLFTSSHSLVTCHYLLKKYTDEKNLREILLKLMDYLTVISVDENILKSGLRSVHKDFEDSIQIFCAATIPDMEGIITRNIKDFKDSHIPALTPDDVCKLLFPGQ